MSVNRATGRAVTAAVLVATLAGCGGGAQKGDDARVNDLSRQVAQLKVRLDADEKRLGSLGFGDPMPLGAVTQTGPANTLVAECPPGSFLFRVPRTAPTGGEALCRAVAGRTRPSQDPTLHPNQGAQ